MKLSVNGTPSPFYLYCRMGGQLVSAHYTYRSLGFPAPTCKQDCSQSS